MEKTIVICIQPKILSTGIRTIFSNHSSDFFIEDARTKEELQACLKQSAIDLIVLHQSLFEEYIECIQTRFIVLANEPNKKMLLRSYAQGACGYLLEKSSLELLLIMAVEIQPGEFLLDPSFAAWLLEYTSVDILPIKDMGVLTQREREIFQLMREGITYQEIGVALHISFPTVKTHIAHIFEKLEIKRRPGKVHDMRGLPPPSGEEA